MKRISIILTICMLLAVLMTACSEAEPQDGTGSKETTEITENSGTEASVTETEISETESSSNSEEESTTESVTDDETSDGETTLEQASSEETTAIDTTEETTAEQHETAAFDSVEKAFEAAEKAQDKITGGTVTLTRGEYYSENISFAFGDGYLRAIAATVDGEKTIHATLGEGGKVCYVVLNPNDFLTPVSINTEAKSKYLQGPAIDLSNCINESVELCGAYDLVDFFYMQYPYTSEEEIEITESIQNGTYSFSYSIEGPAMFYGTATYTVNVSFTLDSAKNYISTLNVTVNAEETYSSETSVITYIQSDDEALRITEKSKYGVEDITPTELLLKDAAGNIISFTNGITDPITAYVAEYNGIEITVSSPATGLLAIYGDIIPVIKDESGNGVEASKAYAYYQVDSSKVIVDIHQEGEYYINIPVGETTFVVPIKANWKTPTEEDFNPSYFDIPVGAITDEWIHVDEISCYTGQSILLRAELAVGCKPDMFKAEIKSGTAGATLTESFSADYTYDGYSDLVYKFVASKEGTYTVIFTSTDNSAVTKSITLNVSKAPEMSELTEGKWTYSYQDHWGETVSIAVNFYPSNGESGTLTVDYSITTYDGYAVSYHIVYSYTIEENEINTAWVSETYTENGTTVDSSEYKNDTAVSVSDSYNIEFDGYELEQISKEPDAKA